MKIGGVNNTNAYNNAQNNKNNANNDMTSFGGHFKKFHFTELGDEVIITNYSYSTCGEVTGTYYTKEFKRQSYKGKLEGNKGKGTIDQDFTHVLVNEIKKSDDYTPGSTIERVPYVGASRDWGSDDERAKVLDVYFADPGETVHVYELDADEEEHAKGGFFEYHPKSHPNVVVYPKTAKEGKPIRSTFEKIKDFFF